MADINITRDSKLIKLFASQVRNERIDSDKVEEAQKIVNELAEKMDEASVRQLAQTVAFTVDELQQKSLDFLNNVADTKNIGYREQAAFQIKDKGIKAYIQAKGSTTARSYVADHQILVETKEISARPAINIIDLRAQRVNMADLIAEANTVITNKKLVMIERVLHDAIDDYASPFYGTATGVNKAVLDAQIAYFRRLGPVTLLGDAAAVSQLSSLAGMAMSNTQTQYSNEMINEHNNNGFIGRYNGCDACEMVNTYEDGKTTPILDPNWIYILPGAMSPNARNLKIVNEGPVNAFASQNIDDLVYETRIDQWFGVAFVVGKNPTMGAYQIG